MRDETIARSYAETLLELARGREGIEAYGERLDAVARLLEDEPSFRRFLETPRISGAEKKALLRRVFADELPRGLLHFLLITVDKRRQRLLPAIAGEYRALVDERSNRVRVEVTVAREPEESTVDELARGLSRLLEKEAIPQLRVRPEILGGVIFRTGDTIYDGSLRRRLARLRRRLLSAELG